MINLNKNQVIKITEESIKELIKNFKKVNENNDGFTNERDTQIYLYNLMDKKSDGKLTQLIKFKDDNNKEFYDFLIHVEYKIKNKIVDLIVHNPDTFDSNNSLLVLIEIKFDHYSRIKGDKHSFLKDAKALNKIIKGDKKGYCLILNYGMKKSNTILKHKEYISDFLNHHDIDTEKISIDYFASFEDKTYEYYRIKKDEFIKKSI